MSRPIDIPRLSRKNEEIVKKHTEISGFPATEITEVRKMIDPTTEHSTLTRPQREFKSYRELIERRAVLLQRIGDSRAAIVNGEGDGRVSAKRMV